MSEVELERFRQAWRDEVSQRQQPSSSSSGTGSTATTANGDRHTRTSTGPAAQSRLLDDAAPVEMPPGGLPPHQMVLEEPAFLSAHPDAVTDHRVLAPGEQEALSLFERAVEREHVGKMMDAVELYRKAFKVDEKVDLLYREKYFAKKPPATTTPESAQSSSSRQKNKGKTVAPVAPVAAAGESAIKKIIHDDDEEEEGEDGESGSGSGGKPSADIESLVQQLSGMSIAPEDESQPCHLAKLPIEIIEYILCQVAVAHLPSFARSLQACRLLHHLGTHTPYIWQTLSGLEYPSQHYHEDCGAVDDHAVVQADPYLGSWRSMYLKRPRVRFDGMYISTCNYMRPGATEGWHTPILMVTYYRYLRFFRDGVAMSLLTTEEPRDVVPVFVRHSPGSMPNDRAGGTGGLTNSGRHRRNLRNEVTVQRADGTTLIRPQGIVYGDWAFWDVHSGDLRVETEGSVARYSFQLELNVRSSGLKRHNKLKWNGFWNVDKATGVRDEFSLKNDKAFFFAPYEWDERLG